MDKNKRIEEGDIVVARGGDIAGLVVYVEHSRNLVEVLWPDDSGLGAVMALNTITRLATSQQLLTVLQEIVEPLMLQRAAARRPQLRSGAGLMIIEPDEETVAYAPRRR